jgi:hypothetical protein
MAVWKSGTILRHLARIGARITARVFGILNELAALIHEGRFLRLASVAQAADLT